MLALVKNVLHFLSSILEIRYLIRNERKVEEIFDKHSDIMITPSRSLAKPGTPELDRNSNLKQEAVFNMFMTYMQIRSQRRIEMLNIVQSSIRILMLNNLLSLPLSDWIDDV